MPYARILGVTWEPWKPGKKARNYCWKASSYWPWARFLSIPCAVDACRSRLTPAPE